MSLKINIEKQIPNFNLNINFEQDSGILGLLGASGSGKSMTLKCISGLVTPSKGSIILNDKILFDSDKKINLSPQKRKVGYLFQNYALFPHMNVTQNIESGLFHMNKDQKDSLVQDFIKRFKLNNLEKHYPHELSGGQMQRVALARVLITNPDILLLDEPFSALDIHLKNEIEKDLLNTLHDYNGIVLYVTHDISEAYRICDDIIVYDKGKTLSKNNKVDLFNQPKNITEAKLTGCRNILSAKKIKHNTIYANNLGYEFKVKNTITDDVNFLCIRSHNIKITSCNYEENTYPFQIINIIENPFNYLITLKNPNNDFNGLVDIEISKDNINYKLNDIIYLQFKKEDVFYF